MWVSLGFYWFPCIEGDVPFRTEVVGSQRCRMRDADMTSVRTGLTLLSALADIAKPIRGSYNECAGTEYPGSAIGGRRRIGVCKAGW